MPTTPSQPENYFQFEKLLVALARAGVDFAVEDFDLDIFTQMRGKSLDDFRPRLRYLETGGVRIPYLAPEDLVFLKRGSWREKDQIDVTALKKILDAGSKE
jgi:hypothetical protein